MICPKCNYNNPEGAAFCQGCGSPLTAEPAQAGAAAAAAKLPFKLDKKVLIGAVAAVVAVILLIIIISAIASGGSDFIEVKDYINASYNSDDDETTFTFNSKVLGDKVDGRATGFVYSADGSHALCAVENEDEDEDEDEDDYYYGSSTSVCTVYHVSKSGVKKIADSATDWEISLDGKRACYIDDEGVLYAYTLGNGKSEKVAEDVGSTPVMSPDGKTILYVVTEEVEEDEDEDEESSTTTERKLYSWKNGKSNSIGKNYSPVAVSNNGKYVYITLSKDGELSLYVTKIGSDDKNKLDGDVDYWDVNYDRTEILYASGSKAYLSVKGKEGVKVSGSMGFWVAFAPNGYNRIVKTFVKVPMVYAKDYSSTPSVGFIKKAGKEYEIVRLVGSVNYAENTGDMIYFTKTSGDLCRIKIKENAESETLLEDVVSFKLSASGKFAYALDDDDTLWKVNGKKKDKVEDDIESDSHYYPFGDGVLYIAEYDSKSDSGVLYYSSNGKKGTKISEDVTDIYVPAPGAKVATYENEDGDEFISGNGKKYTKY